MILHILHEKRSQGFPVLRGTNTTDGSPPPNLGKSICKQFLTFQLKVRLCWKYPVEPISLFVSTYIILSTRLTLWCWTWKILSGLTLQCEFHTAVFLNGGATGTSPDNSSLCRTVWHIWRTHSISGASLLNAPTRFWQSKLSPHHFQMSMGAGRVEKGATAPGWEPLGLWVQKETQSQNSKGT